MVVGVWQCVPAHSTKFHLEGNPWLPNHLAPQHHKGFLRCITCWRWSPKWHFMAFHGHQGPPHCGQPIHPSSGWVFHSQALFGDREQGIAELQASRSPSEHNPPTDAHLFPTHKPYRPWSLPGCHSFLATPAIHAKSGVPTCQALHTHKQSQHTITKKTQSPMKYFKAHRHF